MSRPMPGGGDPQAGPVPGAPDQGPPPVASAGGPPGSSPVGQPASPEQMKLAIMFQACQSLQQSNPQISAHMAEACRAIQNAQTALLMNRQQSIPPEQNP